MVLTPGFNGQPTVGMGCFSDKDGSYNDKTNKTKHQMPIRHDSKLGGPNLGKTQHFSGKVDHHKSFKQISSMI